MQCYNCKCENKQFDYDLLICNDCYSVEKEQQPKSTKQQILENIFYDKECLELLSDIIDNRVDFKEENKTFLHRLEEVILRVKDTQQMVKEL